MIALHDNSPAVVAPGIYPKWMRPSKRRAPDGAFYCFFRVDGLTDSFAAAGEILEQTKAGLAPGVAFGPEGEGYLRLCYAQPADVLKEAFQRLQPFLSK